MRKKSSLLEDTLFQMLIAAITETLAKLANLKTAGFYQEAQDKINQELEELLGLKADLIRRLSDAHIIEMLTVNEVLDVGRLHYAAELFREEGEILHVQGQIVEEQVSRIRALNMFLEAAFAAGDKLPDIHERIDSLFEELGNTLPEDTLFSLFDYFEKRAYYAKAESAINWMLVVTNQNPEIAFEKKEFYRRLLKKTDVEIETGGFTRRKIENHLK